VHTLDLDGYEWDSGKAVANLEKHKVDFADAALSLEDPYGLVAADPDAAGEQRFICLAADPGGRILVTVFAYRTQVIRIISSRRASAAERRHYRER